MVNDQLSMVNMFTVDLEDWFQGLTSTNPRVDDWPTFESRIEEATDALLDILRQHKIEATFFTLGHVADHHPALIERICAEGHEIGVHGYYHRFVYRMTADEFARELEMGIAALERVTGQRPAGHRAPYFSINADTPWAFDVMREQGIRYDSSVFPVRNMLYGFPGAPRFPYWIGEGENPLLELPASTVRVGGKIMPIAGGFYMRALPYRVSRWAIDQLNKDGHPAILYVHPWELDRGQRYSQVTARERITHYHGRRGLEKKLHRLFSDFRFTSMRKAIEAMELDRPQIGRESVIFQAGSRKRQVESANLPGRFSAQQVTP
jgi:polysaccharide deacetylase family protein (PEP-CTERM system associated)